MAKTAVVVMSTTLAPTNLTQTAATQLTAPTAMTAGRIHAHMATAWSTASASRLLAATLPIASCHTPAAVPGNSYPSYEETEFG